MRNYIVILSLIFGINWATAQVGSSEQMPQFPECENEVRENQEACFYNTIQTFFFQNFKVPEDIVASNYKGTIYAVFEVDTIGKFKTLYIDAVSSSLKEETQRVFDALKERINDNHDILSYNNLFENFQKLKSILLNRK